MGITRDPRGFTISNGKHRTTLCLHPPAQHGHRPSPLTHPHPSALRTSLTPTPIAPLVHRQLLGRTGHRSSSAFSLAYDPPNAQYRRSILSTCGQYRQPPLRPRRPPCSRPSAVSCIHTYSPSFHLAHSSAGQQHMVRQRRSRDAHTTATATATGGTLEVVTQQKRVLLGTSGRALVAGH